MAYSLPQISSGFNDKKPLNPGPSLMVSGKAEARSSMGQYDFSGGSEKLMRNLPHECHTRGESPLLPQKHHPLNLQLLPSSEFS
jgi:hypothetical protein